MTQWHTPNNDYLPDSNPYDYREPEPDTPYQTAVSPSNLLDNLRSLWQWDEIASQISQESQGRIAIVGLAGAGKSELFNRLRGWEISPQPDPTSALAEPWQLAIEGYGSFILADLPAEAEPQSPAELWLTLGDPALILYLLDATVGVTPADYRWIALLRASGRPFLLGLNKCDRLVELASSLREAQQRLGLLPIPISAQTGHNIDERLLPALLDAAPKLALTLGRELSGLRQQAARRVIRQTAVFAAMVSAQPIPVLDIPFQAMLQAGVVLRVGAAYGHPPSGGINREIISTIVSVFGLHYLTQSLIKLIPVLGWVISGLMGSTATLLIGEAAIRYYEAGATIPLPQLLHRPSWLQLLRWPWRRKPAIDSEDDQKITIQSA